MAKTGLYDNIHKKRKRIAAGSKETMRKPGTKGAPTAANFAAAAKTAKPQRAATGGEMRKSNMKKKGYAKGGAAKKMKAGGAVKKMKAGGAVKRRMGGAMMKKKGYAKGGAVKRK
jgi:hypothetical protein